jgi:hypothetical protein
METFDGPRGPAPAGELPRSAELAKTAEHLRLLGIFHYILGGLGIPLSFLPLLHAVVGFVMMVEGEAPPFLGAAMMGFAGLFILIGLIWALGQIAAGYHLRARGCYTFCFVVACIECLSVPLGTVLGIFTIVTLSKDEAKALFRRR